MTGRASRVPGGAAFVVVDITGLVADWLSGAKPNYGMIVSLGNHSTYLSEYGTDYEPVLYLDVDLPYHQLTIEPNLTGKAIPVAITDDAASESNETFVVTLDSPINAALGTNAAITYTINDNDGPPIVQFSAGRLRRLGGDFPGQPCRHAEPGRLSKRHRQLSRDGWHRRRRQIIDLRCPTTSSPSNATPA